jgi:alkylhydroperoxidase family enzyme
MDRIEPLQPPFEPAVDAQLRSMMPGGADPIGLFRTFGKNMPMAQAMQPWGSYLLSRALSVSLRDREIVIDRTTARCGCEYEWGVHVVFFGPRAELTPEQITSLTHGDAGDVCWESERDRVLIRMVDALHVGSTVDDEMFVALRAQFDERQILDLTMLCGWYHAISFTARASGVPLEAGCPTFASVAGPG